MSVSHDPFNGIGQVAIKFLGRHYLVACIEGEEDEAAPRAALPEADAGEVLRAVTADLDHMRAVLMTGIIARERIEELEHELRTAQVPNQVAHLQHDSPEFSKAAHELEALIVVVRESNSYREQDAVDQERRLAELEAGRALLKSCRVSVTTIKAVLLETLAYLAAKSADEPVGEAAKTTWDALKRLLDIG